MVELHDGDTAARRTMTIRQLANPGQASHVQDIPHKLTEWEWLCRTKALDPISSLGYNDELHRNALLEMLPEPLNDHVCEDDDKYPSYRLLKKYVSRQVMLRAHINGKKGPVHNVDQQGDGYQDKPQPENPPGLSEEEWGAVMALRKGKGKGTCACWSCGEQGHRAFECPRGAAGGKAAGPKGGKAGGGKARGNGTYGN